MQSAIYQISLIIGLGTLAFLLLRGYSLLTALFRSGIVLMAVLIVLIVAGGILRMGMRSKEEQEEPTAEIKESLTEDESETGETGRT